MADGVGYTPSTDPSAVTIGTDEVTIGGVTQHVQRVKLVDGTDGGTDLIPGSAANGLDVDVTRIVPPSNSTTTSASVTSTGSLILASNSNRKGLIIQNTSQVETLYIKWGSSPSGVTDAAFPLFPFGRYESMIPFYTGAVYAIGSGSLTAMVTELT